MNKKLLIGIGVVAILGYLWYKHDKKQAPVKEVVAPAPSEGLWLKFKGKFSEFPFFEFYIIKKHELH